MLYLNRSILFGIAILFFLTACGGSGGSSDGSSGGGGGGGATPIESFEVVDPTPGANDQFGANVIILTNGNIVVTDPSDSSVGGSAGAVHLYNPVTQTRVASIYGDKFGDEFGSGGVTALPNGNFVIASPGDDKGSVTNAGSVMLVDGNSGIPIGTPIEGDSSFDSLGSRGVTVLANGNYVIASELDDVSAVTDAGSVMLVDGTTGAQIGSTLAGDNASDQLGSNGVTALTNGHYVIASQLDDVSAVTDAGSVMLVDGTTGVQIGSTLAGDNTSDQLGSSDVTALTNGHYVIASQLDDVGAVTDAGSVILVDGTTGAQIGSAIAGDNASDQLGSSGVTALTGGSYVIASRFDDVSAISDAGSVMLVDGATGTQIGTTIAGDEANDSIGSSGVTALTNGHYVIASPYDTVNLFGSVMLIDGTTGIQIGSTISGDNVGDFLGSLGVKALANGNYVIATRDDDVGGVSRAGSVMVVDGSTGVQIGSTIAGDDTDDEFGFGGVTALPNGNFVVISRSDDVNGISDAGSVTVISGSTGMQIGSTIAGSTTDDLFFGASVVAESANGNYFLLGSPLWDNNSLTDSGLVRLIAL